MLFGLVPYPSCVEVIVILALYLASSVEVVMLWVYGCPSCVEVIVVEFGFVPLSLLYKGDCCFGFMPYLLSRGDCVERGVVYSNFVIANSSMEVPCVGGPVWRSGNLSV